MTARPSLQSGSRVAVVHDWLTGMRGGEKVLEAILSMFPEADLFTLFHFRGKVSEPIESHRIHTSWLQPVAALVPNYRYLLPLFPAAIRCWDLSSYDLVISSSHCVAHGARTGSSTHISYCHTPMRYVWDRFDDYFPPERKLLRLMAAPMARWLRRWDVRSSSRVGHFIANSEFVRGRIRRYYGRDATVIHPFVGEEFFVGGIREERDDYDVVLSALVDYKKVELVIEAARKGSRRLIVAGSGPLRKRLAETAPPNVEFRGFVSTGEIIELLSRARALILPGVEDFGITPLEAMACGTPVIAFGAGGALETVIEGETGLFFTEPNAEALLQVMREAGTRKWNRSALRERARKFSRAHFTGRLMEFLPREKIATG